ncbi:secondary thiamine-phosphate synthase enzyme YjbQ [Rhodoblastus sp. 17X3]|uniref:secondary thiamine-phosphate synthase enzyme YjbQ n=1 Tax=Rhodoblastus sp. 17X3 TaxID=3047026 RepID=UPI0024B6680E|nr:secondary thiamine-phosphate synthase enzyme YjbQ [Rhodoblastus sp. 17X3]MDI9849045.1 secondary thiamine-phosphate synthase enzyme YjbQ [Rhodoblastus sp. 17X3]
MRQAQQKLIVATSGRGLFEFTREARAFLRASGLTFGQLTVFCRHTSASLLIQENADPSVLDDLLAFFDRLAPEGRGLYSHENEGADDMPAHLRTALTQVSLAIPFAEGDLMLGTWQGIYLFEHRRAPHRREVILHAVGE